ncbi:hypothetical protein [Bradyrhizobium erythrophlei]|nr:hypothetical protein [Bradyrhizobium erythrophlei]
MHEVIICSAAGERLGGLGQRGVPLAPFSHPADVHVSAWGEIYVSDGYAASRVHRFDAGGALIASWGSHGSGDGQFGWPRAIWTFADGRVVVVDRSSNRVQVFDREGKHLETWGGFYQPVAIWGDDEGCAYVSDMVPSLQKVGPKGERLGRCRPVLNGAHGIFGTPDGDILLAEGKPRSFWPRANRVGSRGCGSGQLEPTRCASSIFKAFRSAKEICPNSPQDIVMAYLRLEICFSSVTLLLLCYCRFDHLARTPPLALCRV